MKTMAVCNYCGKEFDYDKFFGICPECGQYNEVKSEPEAPQTTADELEAAYAEKGYTSADEVHVNAEESMELADKKGAKTRASLIIVLCILGFMIVAIFVYGFVYMTMTYATIPEPELMETEMEVVGDQGTKTISAELLDGLTYTLLEAETVATHEDYEDIPEGEKMIALQINVKSGNYTYESANQVGTIYVGDKEKRIFRSYITEYHLADFRDAINDGRRIFDDFYPGYSDTEEGRTGWLYFIVPEDFTDLTMYISAEGQYDNLLKGIYGIDFTL